MYPEQEGDYATAKEVRKSKLPLAEQDKCILEQSEIVSMLLDRLEPVLTPQPGPPSKEAMDRTLPMQSQMASELAGNNERIRRNTNRLSNALERLEV